VPDHGVEEAGSTQGAAAPTAGRAARVLAVALRAIDAVNDRVGRWSAWLALLLVLVTMTDVTMRYLFRISFVFVQELEWHLFALIFLITAGYAHLLNSHVRVDIFYVRLRPRTQAWVDLVCGIVFLLPAVFMLVWSSIPFVAASVKDIEGSPDPGGIPFRFVLKAVIPLAFLLLGLQGISEIVKSWYRALGKEAPR
jgi:TRAP-type mannitol/chloroaromatic compound transport system permease small subunit